MSFKEKVYGQTLLHLRYVKCSQCVVTKFPNKTLILLVNQEKKNKVVIAYWMLFHGNITTAVLRHAGFPQFRQLH